MDTILKATGLGALALIAYLLYKKFSDAGSDVAEAAQNGGGGGGGYTSDPRVMAPEAPQSVVRPSGPIVITGLPTTPPRAGGKPAAASPSTNNPPRAGGKPLVALPYTNHPPPRPMNPSTMSANGGVSWSY